MFKSADLMYTRLDGYQYGGWLVGRRRRAEKRTGAIVSHPSGKGDGDEIESHYVTD